jgi:hypothetical protein
VAEKVDQHHAENGIAAKLVDGLYAISGRIDSGRVGHGGTPRLTDWTAHATIWLQLGTTFLEFFGF